MAGKTSRRALAVLTVLLAVGAQAQEWPVDLPAMAASEGAPVVVRLYETEYDVDGPGRAATRVRLVMTALNAAGREEVGRMSLVHGGFRTLRRLDGTLYDASGQEIRRLGRDDVSDRVLGSIYEDLRVRDAALFSERTPFTVEWTYEIDHRGVLGWPTWRPQQNGWPVEQAVFRLVTPTDMAVRTLPRDLPVPTETFEGRSKRTEWRMTRLRAAEIEPMGPPGWEQLPELRIGTSDFEIGGASGRLDSWGAFGAWYDGLSEGRQRLPEAAAAEVRRIVEGAATDAEKVRRLYRHLQQTTRYVSIQLGLGGWQPFDAAYVFERRYGDCKALTNYMMAMLEAVGVDSDPVLIEAGDNGSDLDEGFPDNAFNHVVLRVPLPASGGPSGGPGTMPMRTGVLSDGAVWLECTSSYAAFGHLGAFTEGRPALLVDGPDSRIVRTPVSGPDVNWSHRDATVVVDDRGRARADISWTLHGEGRTDALVAFDRASESERSVVLNRATGMSGVDVLSLDLSAVAARLDTLALRAELAVPQIARRAGSRLLLGLTPLTPLVEVPPASEGERRHEVRLGTAYAERDSVRFVLPEGYSAGDPPAPIEVTGPVGRYRLSVTAGDGVLVAVRDLIVDAPRQPAERYDEVRAFFRAVAEADGTRAVLRRE